MATHSTTLAWKIPWTEEPGRLQSMGSLRVGLAKSYFTFHFSLSCIREGNGNPLQCSCLENPRDGRAWWATVYGVTHSRTRLRISASMFISDIGLQFSFFVLSLSRFFFFFFASLFHGDGLDPCLLYNVMNLHP